MRICGLDPGLGITGYAVIDHDGLSASIVEAGVCRSEKSLSLARRLVQLEADIRELLSATQPQKVAVEQLYAHYKHPRTAILMGHARGVLLCAAASLGIEVYSYSATRVKRFLTGNGRAPKPQVQRAIAATLGLATVPSPADVADALAIALCCACDNAPVMMRRAKRISQS